MTRSVQISMRMTPKTIDVIDTFRKKSGVSRPTFIEDMVFVIDILSKNPEKLQDLVGPIFYEKYFKNF